MLYSDQNETNIFQMFPQLDVDFPCASTHRVRNKSACDVFAGTVQQQTSMTSAPATQFIMQPDGTLIPAPQPVQPTPTAMMSPAQPALQPVITDPATQAVIAQPMQPVATTQAQFVDPAQPQVVYQVCKLSVKGHNPTGYFPLRRAAMQ